MIQERNKTINVEEEIDLGQIIKIIWQRKTLCFLVTICISFLSIIFALSLPNTYTSKTILAPSQESGISSDIAQFSSIASFAGVNLSGNQTNRSQEAITRLRSFDFFSKFIIPNISLENIVAVKKWKHESNEIIYDEKVFDRKLKKWKFDGEESLKPSEQEAFIIYNNLLSISTDKSTGFITISVTHISPHIAKKLLDTFFDIFVFLKM